MKPYNPNMPIPAPPSWVDDYDEDFDEENGIFISLMCDVAVRIVTEGDARAGFVIRGDIAADYDEFAFEALGCRVERQFEFDGTRSELAYLVNSSGLDDILLDQRFRIVGRPAAAMRFGFVDSIEAEGASTFVARTPNLIIWAETDSSVGLAGGLRALDSQAVAALKGLRDADYIFARDADYKFDGTRAELIVLAWGSSLADLLADQRFQIKQVKRRGRGG